MTEFELIITLQEKGKDDDNFLQKARRKKDIAQTFFKSDFNTDKIMKEITKKIKESDQKIIRFSK